MRLLLDTHILIWLVLNDRRLSAAQRAALGDPDNAMIVSPVVAYELTHLQRTRRIPLSEPIDRLQELTGFELADLPRDSWRSAADLPDIHRDPIDRLLVSHALCEEMVIVTADANIRRYPVPSV
jgi:PIN domain nuclease of toxin-antitoxin system